MAIIIQEPTDIDILRACEMEAAAYANNAANPVLFPGPFPADSRQQRVDQIIKMRKDDPTTKFLQAVDEETGEIIAFAKWHIYETSEAATAAPTRPSTFGPGTNKEACEAFFGGIVEKKKEIMGNKPHLYLHMLHTDPKHQGRGAGGLLLKWGTEKADGLSLPTYLESSPEGHQFYQKYGFKDIEIFTLDLSNYGGKGLHIAPLMIREPTHPT